MAGIILVSQKIKIRGNLYIDFASDKAMLPVKGQVDYLIHQLSVSLRYLFNLLLFITIQQKKSEYYYVQNLQLNLRIRYFKIFLSYISNDFKEHLMMLLYINPTLSCQIEPSFKE